MGHLQGEHRPEAWVQEPEDFPSLLLQGPEHWQQGPRMLLAISILRETWRQLRQGTDYLLISGKFGKYLGVKKEAGLEMSKHFFWGS